MPIFCAALLGDHVIGQHGEDNGVAMDIVIHDIVVKRGVGRGMK